MGNVAAEQKTSRPFPNKVVIVLVEIGQFDVSLVVPARTLVYPTHLTRLVAQQSIAKLSSRDRDPILRKQRTHALLGISQR